MRTCQSGCAHPCTLCKLGRGLTYNSQLCIGVDLPVLIAGHTLIHAGVSQGQATD